jgi:DNA-binding MarR family transcriptional regulator
MSSLSSENQLPQPLEQVAFLTCIKAADILLQGVTRLLKPSDLSISQYNILRILRGALSDGLPCQQISERMISHNPDITRLIDRMEKAGWVQRSRDQHDRRKVMVRIKWKGLQLLSDLDEPVLALQKRQFAALSEGQMGQLLDLLKIIDEI